MSNKGLPLCDGHPAFRPYEGCQCDACDHARKCKEANDRALARCVACEGPGVAKQTAPEALLEQPPGP